MKKSYPPAHVLSNKLKETNRSWYVDLNFDDLVSGISSLVAMMVGNNPSGALSETI
jgi:hypothetical protein